MTQNPLRMNPKRSVFPLIAIIIFLFTLPVKAQELKEKDKIAIKQIMKKQESAWNKGDLKAFMDGYWVSDSMMFIGKSGVSYGWKAALARYERGYPDKKAMGKLTFTFLRMKKTDKKTALVVGKYHLTLEDGNKEGHFSLIWRKIGKEWVITSDHSS